MKKGIHPNYDEITATCSCGNVENPLHRWSRPEPRRVRQMPPFFTGKQRDVATGGRVDRFNKRFSIPGSK